MTDEKKAAKPKKVEIRCMLKEGKLFGSLGVIKAGEVGQATPKEAKLWVSQGKASIPFPDE